MWYDKYKSFLKALLFFYFVIRNFSESEVLACRQEKNAKDIK